MKKGIIYLMKTVIPGLIKIGKTSSDQFENRMRILENNGYSNITGLKREFAIEVDEYDEKEKLLHNIFSKSQIAETEFFALDIELVKSLLSSFDGKKIYPQDKTKEEVFNEFTEKLKSLTIPNGIYKIKRKVKGFGEVYGKAIVKDGIFTVKKGSVCFVDKKDRPNIIKDVKIVNNILMEDFECRSPSTAGLIIIGKSNNGWKEWKDISGDYIDKYRYKEN